MYIENILFCYETKLLSCIDIYRSKIIVLFFTMLFKSVNSYIEGGGGCLKSRGRGKGEKFIP